MFKKVTTSALAYKKEENEAQDEEDDEEMGLLDLLGRIILFPLVVPIFMVYITFFARGTPIAAEIDNLDSESESEASYNSEDDYLSNWERAVRATKVLHAYLCCKKNANIALDASNKSLSYEAFMSRKQDKMEPPQTTKVQNTYKYEPVIDVARTDRVEFEEDGVFIKNLWVPLNDKKTMETLLGEIEKQALLEEEAQDRDEWQSTPSIKGEARKVIEDLLHKAKNREGIHPSSPSKQKNLSVKPGSKVPRKSPTTSPNPTAGGATSPSITEISANMSTPSAKKKSKPKKTPLPEGTPLSERMNLEQVASAHQVDGPSVDLHVPEGLMKMPSGSPP